MPAPARMAVSARTPACRPGGGRHDSRAGRRRPGRPVRECAHRPSRTIKPHPQLDALTDRERETVALVAEGMTNDEIAARLRISPATARTHVSRAMVKLGARDRAQLVVFAYQSGLVD